MFFVLALVARTVQFKVNQCIVRDVAKGADRVCHPPWGFGATRAEGPRGPKLRRKQPKLSQKSRNLCGNRQKSTLGQSGTL